MDWTSPLTPERLARGAMRLGFPMFGVDGTLTYIESRPAEGGRAVVVEVLADGRTRDRLPAPHGARSKVHEYGGASHLTLADGTLCFVQASDQQLWLLPPRGEARPLTCAPGTRFGEPVWDAARGRLLAIQERHDVSPVENRIVAVDPTTGAIDVLVAGRDFLTFPAPSPDGRELAFVAWDHPNMPWDAAEVWCADLAPDGRPASARHIAGDRHASAGQPTWGPDGALYFVAERDGAWKLHQRTPAGVRCVSDLPGEIGGAPWLIGTRAFAFTTPGHVVASVFTGGLTTQHLIAVSDGSTHPIAAEPAVAQLCADAERAILVTGWAGGGSQLLACDVRTGQITAVREVYEGLIDPADTSQPESVWFDSDGVQVHAFFYAPRNSSVAVDSRLPPLIVIAHGGPTGCAVPTLNPTIQFFTTRGFAVLDVNYRGSTGFGRPYRDALRAEWGVIDVADVVRAARAMADAGRVDARRMVIRGGSAGGFTVLQALSEHDVFAAGSCHYGVSDLAALVHDTHKFESHYDRFLIGEGPEAAARILSRSPIHHAERIRVPVIFFQGADDAVVPADQTSRMYEDLRRRGVPAELHVYDGEGHGFRSAVVIEDVLRRELAFLQRTLGP